MVSTTPAKTSAIPCQDMGAVPYAKIAALPVVMVTAGSRPIAPVAIQPVVIITDGSVKIAPVNPRYMSLVSPGTRGLKAAKVTPIPIVVVG